MKQFDAEAGGRRSLPSWAGRLASIIAVAALALFAAPVAKADVVVPETFDLSGSFSTFAGLLIPFSGTISLDFSNGFADETPTSVSISVQGHVVFNQSASLHLATSADGVIGASNGAHDTLSLTFAIPTAGTWVGFTQGAIAGGQLVFGGLNGFLFNATGEVVRNGPAIIDPPPPIVDPPPPVIDPPPPITGPPDPPTAAVPELSTWTMLLLGLAGLGLAAKRRRALGFLGGKA